MAKPARKRKKLPDWVIDPDFVQPTKSTRTFKKKRVTGTKKSQTKWSGRTKNKAKRDVLGQ